MRHSEVSLQDKYVLNYGKAYISGIQALVRLPIEQRRRDIEANLNTAGFISGYRGSPLGGYDTQLMAAKTYLDEHDVRFWPGLNEDLGATAVWGSQALGLFPGAKFDGVFGLWYGKAPGVDRTGDAFKHANFAGTSKHGGVLAIAGDDPNCKSSTLPSQSDFAFMDAEIPYLSPINIQEVLDYGLYGIAMSRYSGAWVGLITNADLMDASTVIDVNLGRITINTPDDADTNDLSMRRNDEPMAKEARLRNQKLAAARKFVALNNLDGEYWHNPNAEIGIIGAGQSFADTLEALDTMGIDANKARELGVALYKVAMPWPLETKKIAEFTKGKKLIIMIEHKRAIIEPQLKEYLYSAPIENRPIIIGKKDEIGDVLFSDIGSIPVDAIGRALLRYLPKDDGLKRAHEWLKQVDRTIQTAIDLQGDSRRVPHFCSGCPHNTSTKVPDGSRALAGIGCHYMATFMPDRETDMTSHMGGEGVSWIGQALFTDEEHVFSNLGDGTYSHSGSLAIRAAVTGNVNITYKLLYNDAVAMTGGQRAESGQSVPQIAKQLLGEGVAQVVIVTDDVTKYKGVDLEPSVEIYGHEKLHFVQNKLRKTKGVTVLIYDQMCATEKRRRIKRGLMKATSTRVFINPAVCEGCGDCSKQSNCLSIHPLETELGTKREIDQSSCNQDTRCVDGFCPSFVTVEGAVNAKRQRPRPEFDATLLPLPEPIDLKEPYSFYFAGVGGTGVTTASAIIGMAAHIDGKSALTMDMTGLAQKGGQVLSHIRIAHDASSLRTGRIPVSKADAAIIGDLIVATNGDALNIVSKDHTIAVASTDIVPTSEFIHDRNRRYRNAPKVELFSKAVKRLDTINAEALANEYLYDGMFANMILMGFAWQKGMIPVSLRGIYRALKLNKVAVNDNMLAFDLGRIAAYDPQRLQNLVPPRTPPQRKTLDELINHRRDLLMKYQNKAYADKFVNFINECREIEKQKTGKDDLTAIIAAQLSRIMAYKDEYEVARLYSDKGYWDNLRATLGGDLKINLWLSPPLFAKKDADGKPLKTQYSQWIFGVMKILKNLKFLRGSAFDVFGYTEERKNERNLIAQYMDDARMALGKLTPENISEISDFILYSDEIKGYGYVKEKAFKEAQTRREKLLKKVA